LTTMAMKPKKNSSKLSESKNEILNSNVSSISKPLLSLAQLYQGVVVRRPSLHNKSPYVADVTLDEGSTEVIAHAPMLDLGGLIKPGTAVRMTKSKPGGKTSHAVQLVQQK